MKISVGRFLCNGFDLSYVDWLHKNEISCGFTHDLILRVGCQEDQDHQG
jgi:hypothetical protein